MPYEEWIKTIADGRIVKFTWLDLPEGGAYISAQLARNSVVYSLILPKARIPQNREEVESHFANELTKKWSHSTSPTGRPNQPK